MYSSVISHVHVKNKNASGYTKIKQLRYFLKIATFLKSLLRDSEMLNSPLSYFIPSLSHLKKEHEKNLLIITFLFSNNNAFQNNIV